MSSTLLDRVAKDARMNDVIVHKEVVLFTPGFDASRDLNIARQPV
jgi:hypothetical protein